MDLTARKKKKERSETAAPAALTAEQPAQQADGYTHSIVIQCNTLLYTTLQNAIQSAHTANDFTFTSVTDAIRAALQAYQNGMELTELDEAGERKQTSIRVSKSLHDFYKSLPNQLRRKLVERAIRTYLKNLP